LRLVLRPLRLPPVPLLRVRRHAPPLCPSTHPASACYTRLHPRSRRDPIAALRDGRDHRFPVPAYLPPATRALLPFARSSCRTAARRSHVPVRDCWDDAVTALLRAALHFRPGPGTFHAYATTAIRRGLWRYCRRPAHPPTLGLDTVPPGFLPDVESLLIALEDA